MKIHTRAEVARQPQALEWVKASEVRRIKAECWREAYLAGMEAGHHWTVEGGYVAGGDEEAADDYVIDRQAEEAS